MNVTVEHRERTKALEQAERLGAVIRAPPPLWVDRPERNMRKDDKRRTGGELLRILLQPVKLILAERAQPARFEIHHIHQADEVYTFVIKTLPTAAHCAFAIAIQIAFAIV